MAPAPVLSPELTRQSVALARALTAAARSWALYPPEHPAVTASVARLADAINESAGGAAFAFGVTPDTLLVAGAPLPAEGPVADAARLLHDHDILHISFMGLPPLPAVHAFLKLLAATPEDLRATGGPATAWAGSGHAAIAIEQIDYHRILEDREIKAAPERRDDIWRSLVNAIVVGQQEFDQTQQQRLLEISRNAGDIGDLAIDAIEPKRNLDGSPLLTTQAATVLAVFRHLAGIVTVMEPERLPDAMRNIATAAARLDPHVVLQMMQIDEGVQDAPMVSRLAAVFDDDKVATLLATALSRDGKATARLAQVFDTIAPDVERKRRVLTMTRSMLSERDFGKSGQFGAVWSSMETLLLSYDERPYVSGSYQASLEGAAERSDLLAGRDLPPELPEWVDTLGQDNVRSLSVLLVTDLLRIEEHAERAAEITRDMAALVDDLLLAGDFSNCLVVLRELKQAAAGTLAPAAARAALTAVGESKPLLETAALIGDFDAAALAAFSECCTLIGPTVTRVLLPLLQSEHETPAFTRARTLVESFGDDAVPHIARLTEHDEWYVQRTAALLLGATRSAAAVPPLQALLRKRDPRVLRYTVVALAGIADAAAARALQSVLRSATGDSRVAVVQALVAERDTRVVPMLGRILSESDPFGADHQVVLDMLDAVRQFADERAVAAVADVMRRKKLFAGKKARAFKAASVRALIAIGTPRAQAAIDEAKKTGDRVLKRAVREAGR